MLNIIFALINVQGGGLFLFEKERDDGNFYK